MKVKCNHCGAEIESTDELCPNCGAVNDKFQRTASDIPQTIEELKSFCEEKKIPLNKIRVHIGEDYKIPKAFGIYKDEKSGQFVVYKNKADGNRSIRYKGEDEAYAVKEMYLKIKELVDIARQRHEDRVHRQEKPVVQPHERKEYRYKTWWERVLDFIDEIPFFGSIVFIVVVLIVVFTVWMFISWSKEAKRGYYTFEGTNYYYGGGSWYEYDDGDWFPAENVNEDLSGNSGDYYNGRDYSDGYGVSNFDDSDYYNPKWDEDDSEWNDDRWDDDDDWGSDDWSDDDWGGGIDWDSDW